MATSHIFNGKNVKLPGAYSNIKSISFSATISTSYGKVLIINTDPELSFGGSINGELTKSNAAIYRMRTLNEAQSLLRSGNLWNICEPLFRPSLNEGASGASELLYINALTTTAPKLTLSLATGELEIKVKDEGKANNGVATNNILTAGYALSLSTGVRDTSKYIISIYRSTYKGLASDGYAWDGNETAANELVCQSSEIQSVDDFVAWAKNDKIFNEGFVLGKHTAGTFTAEDKTNNSFVLATGGTSAYSASDLTATLELLQNVDFNILLSLNTDKATGSDTINAKLQYFVQNETKHPKYLAIAGAESLEDNLTSATAFNSQRVWLVYGQPRTSASYIPVGYRVQSSVYMAALMVGRIAGLAPQIPPTFKDLNIVGLEKTLTVYEQEDCLDKGVLTAVYDNDLSSFVILRGINTLQNNTSLQNSDGSSFSIQITRICSQLNQDVVLNIKKQIFGDQSGVNANTVSEEYLTDWIKVFLTSKVATETQDNLILGFSDVNVRREGDTYWCSYKFRTNSEIAFIFLTGFAIN